MSWRDRLLLFARCLLAGATIAFSLPPWGWWPLAFLGLAQWDRLLADQLPLARFRRTWLVAVTWFGIAMLWMVDLTPPGYVIAVISYAAYYGAVVSFVPGHAPWRWIGLPAAVVIATAAMWTFPFGGVPLANLALSQAGSCAPEQCARQLDSPLINGARLFGPLFVVVLVVVAGIALSALWERRRAAAGVALGIVVGFTALGFVAPKGHDIGEVRLAIVQGGGPQHTRTTPGESDLVFARHVAATESIDEPVQLILWPENVVSLEGRLEDNPEELRELQRLAREKDAPILAGITEGLGAKGFLNASEFVNPDGTIGDRYDKVRRVPFGEFVPLRSIIERVAGDSGIPSRDAIPGEAPAVVTTDTGTYAVAISWEIYFTDRVLDGVRAGGQAVFNPTNGASYWLTQVQTQQIASTRLRAVESGRWVAQAAPTGFSARVSPEGVLMNRTDVSEQKVLIETISRREGDTLYTTVGPWPVLLGSVAALVAARFLGGRRGFAPDQEPLDPTDEPFDPTGSTPLV